MKEIDALNIDGGNDRGDLQHSAHIFGEPLLIVFSDNIALNLKTTTFIMECIDIDGYETIKYHLGVDHIHSFLFIAHIFKHSLRRFPTIQLFTEPKHRELCPIHIALSQIE